VIHAEAIENLIREGTYNMSNSVAGIERNMTWALSEARRIDITESLAKGLAS